MARPTLLVAEKEPAQALSTRKLILETGKFNVLTAHSVHEAVEICEGTPLLAAMIATADLGSGVEKLVRKTKKLRPELTIICLSPNRTEKMTGADHHLSSHEPEELLELCKKLFGDPRRNHDERRL